MVILYGYLPCKGIIRNGDDAAILLLQAIQKWQDKKDGIDEVLQHDPSIFKYNRSYGHSQRGVEVIAQDEDTNAVSEVLSTKLRQIRGGLTIEGWLDQVQEILQQHILPDVSPCPLRILGRQDIQNASKFNAELDVTQRRIEYLIPVECISWNAPEAIKAKLESLPPFSDSTEHFDAAANKTDEQSRIYLFALKKLMQVLTTQVADLDVSDETAVLQKKSSIQKRKHLANSLQKKKKKEKSTSEDTKSKTSQEKDLARDDVKINEKHRVLRRKRYHNFTETVMAHEFLAYRRMDRMYHRSTLVFPSIDLSSKPFIILCVTGDLFLTGQLRRAIAVFLALANNLIDKDIVDCLFDEDYPRLVPTPSAAAFGMISSEARYMTWEGKLKSILSPRKTDRYPGGWNQESTIDRCRAWQDIVRQEVAKKWLERGRESSDTRTKVEKEWTECVLLPWVEQAKEYLAEYRQWRKQNGVNIKQDPQQRLLPSEPIDATVPKLFEQVLFHLRKVDESGQWPSTTSKRQLVMVSTEEQDDPREQKTTSLSLASLNARSKNGERSSAYAFTEGQGGASGSFSVGLMPGIGSKTPKSNYLFPELVKAAFELERALCPEREASSTIAINRNAQFRPHTDSGAGAGQSTSLIVGLGNYTGGELMVEGVKHNIRYQAIEFNGWKQRHWTLPFVGERYSLVWFTPKGCEGMRGIDMDLSVMPEDGESRSGAPRPSSID